LLPALAVCSLSSYFPVEEAARRVAALEMARMGVLSVWES